MLFGKILQENIHRNGNVAKIFRECPSFFAKTFTSREPLPRKYYIKIRKGKSYSFQLEGEKNQPRVLTVIPLSLIEAQHNTRIQ